MTVLEQHAQTYGEQPERRDAYLQQLARERALAALEADTATPSEKPAKASKQTSEA